MALAHGSSQACIAPDPAVQVETVKDLSFNIMAVPFTVASVVPAGRAQRRRSHGLPDGLVQLRCLGGTPAHRMAGRRHHLAGRLAGSSAPPSFRRWSCRFRSYGSRCAATGPVSPWPCVPTLAHPVNQRFTCLRGKTSLPSNSANAAAYAPYFRALPLHAADYTFTNLWGWGTHYNLEWRTAHGLCWIRQKRNDLPVERLWAPVGDWYAADWAAMPELVPGTTILRAPEPLCELLLERLPGRVAIEETPGQWEYLYTQEALSTLAGNKLHKKKNHVNGYMKAYGEDYRALNGEIMPQVLALQDDWCKWRECEKSASLLAESDVVCSVLRNWDALPGLIGGALYAGEEMAAFAVGEPLDDQTIVVHFEKGRPEYRGVYQAINFCFAKYAAKNFVFINREQDADEEGLRQAKESYMPSGYLKKNTIRIVK